MRTCVIFNPTARGDKARRFRRHLDEIGAQSTLKLTTSAGDARRLAAEAVREGFEIVVAAGGDGTVNEVLNGLADEPGGLRTARLAVLPLGTVNVFARELSIPRRLTEAWAIIRRGRESRIDLPAVEYLVNGISAKRHFAQLGGAGLDAQAIQLVHWELKKKIGPLAYVLAGLQALRKPQALITVAGDGQTVSGGLVLWGNGRLYGGSYRVFPRADLRDGLVDVCVFPRADWATLARCGPSLLCRGRLPDSMAQVFQFQECTLTCPVPMPFEVDGELVGELPAKVTVCREALGVIVP